MSEWTTIERPTSLTNFFMLRDVNNARKKRLERQEMYCWQKTDINQAEHLPLNKKNMRNDLKKKTLINNTEQTSLKCLLTVGKRLNNMLIIAFTLNMILTHNLNLFSAVFASFKANKMSALKWFYLKTLDDHKILSVRFLCLIAYKTS